MEFYELYQAITDWMADKGFRYAETITFPPQDRSAEEKAEKWVSISGDAREDDGLYLFLAMLEDECGHPYMQAEDLSRKADYRFTIYCGDVRLER